MFRYYKCDVNRSDCELFYYPPFSTPLNSPKWSKKVDVDYKFMGKIDNRESICGHIFFKNEDMNCFIAGSIIVSLLESKKDKNGKILSDLDNAKKNVSKKCNFRIKSKDEIFKSWIFISSPGFSKRFNLKTSSDGNSKRGNSICYCFWGMISSDYINDDSCIVYTKFSRFEIMDI